MKALLIVNEHAGKGKTKKYWPQIQRCLQNFEIEHDVHFTSGPKEAVEAARQAAANQYSHVIAVGGDGTVNEVVNGIAGKNTVFGVLPTGTGNDLARMLNIPTDPLLAVRRISDRRQKSIDLLKLKSTYIAGAIGIGFDGAVAEDMNRASWKKRAGSFGYVLSTLKLIFKFPPFTLYLFIDDQTVIFRDCWLVAIGNSQFYGGGMRICPDAIEDDGILDVCVVHNLSQIELLRLFPCVFSGRHIFHPNVVCLRGKEVRIHTDPTVPIHGDGEMMGTTPSEIFIQPQALHVIY